MVPPNTLAQKLPNSPEHAIVAAYGTDKQIGYQNTLPWHLPTDLAHFKQLTRNHTVVMGRKTYDSIGHGLPYRTNIVLSRDTDLHLPDAHIAHSLSQALQYIPENESQCFYIGGTELFASALLFVSRMYLTEVQYSGPADSFFPDFDPTDWQLTHYVHPEQSINDQYPIVFKTYDRVRPLTHQNPNQ